MLAQRQRLFKNEPINLNDFQIILRYTDTEHNFEDGEFPSTKTKTYNGFGPHSCPNFTSFLSFAAESPRWQSIDKTCRMCWPSCLSMTWSSALLMWRRQNRCCEIHASVINVIKHTSTYGFLLAGLFEANNAGGNTLPSREGSHIPMEKETHLPDYTPVN